MTDETRRERRDRSRRHRDSSGRHQSQRRQSESQRARRSRTADEGSRHDRGESQSLSSDALARLERENRRQQREKDRDRRARRDQVEERQRNAERRHRERERGRERRSRAVSGAIEGRAGDWRENSLEDEEFLPQDEKRRSGRKKKKSRRKVWIIIGVSLLLLVIVIVVAAVVASKKKHQSSGSGGSGPNLSGISHGDIPPEWQGTYLDPFTWASTSGFNTTFTDAAVGDLPLMGLMTAWDDSARANDKVPPLSQPWGNYSQRPARGVNLGGWLSLEPFITPSLFSQSGVVDEWTLCESLGAAANKTIEAHYATFVTEQTFRDIAAAGLDHVRIPFSYWAVETYPGDPYLFRTSWRYLVRGIEWARKYGLRVNLDVHGLPGSQNGWNHSGRLGPIGWLNGTDGQLNAQRALSMHDRLSKFFAQDRYRSIITHYGLANEPRMTLLKTSDVVSWTESAHRLVRGNGVAALIVFGDGFMGLDNWQGLMSGLDGLVLDVHQYVIFNKDQINLSHQAKIQYACAGWTQQARQSMDPATGFGPTLFAEWSQADTDCARFLNNVGQGSRWEGTFNSADKSAAVTAPDCPAKDASCSCAGANADPGKWSAAYKQFLRMFAEAQMHSFEQGYGWWYWTWKTESAAQWSYQAGMQAGVLPSKAYQRDFQCDGDVPDFAKSGLSETY